VIRWAVLGLALGLAACAGPPPGAVAPAETGVVVAIDLSDQAMTVRRDGVRLGVWPVSTARAGKTTPVGDFRPERLARVHYSTLYDGAPMPWSIFFAGNYAIHGTTEVARLGCPASAGCVRLHPENARTLFALVSRAGPARTVIRIRP